LHQNDDLTNQLPHLVLPARQAAVRLKKLPAQVYTD